VSSAKLKEDLLPAASTTTELVVTPGTPSAGMLVTFEAHVTSTGPTDSPLSGLVAFYANGTLLGNAEVDDGTATYGRVFDDDQPLDVYAVFTPDTNYLGSTSSHLQVQFQPLTVIDIMAVYTPEALSDAGSAYDVRFRFQQRIDDANQAFLNSL